MKNVFYRFGNNKGFWQSQMMMGMMTIAFGIAILVFPQLLQALVAGLFIMIGLFLMLSALTLKRMQSHMGQAKKDVFDV